MEQPNPNLDFVDLACDCSASEIREEIEDLLLQVQYFLTFSTALLFCELGDKKQRIQEIFLYLNAMVEKCNYSLCNQNISELEENSEFVYEQIDEIHENLTNLAWELEKYFPNVLTSPTDPPLRILLEAEGNTIPYVSYFASCMDC